MHNNKPNILLIVTDEMRGDCIGAAGHPDVKTPYLDTLLQNGVYYPNAVSTCPSCIAARAALHTGQSQERHGRVGYQDGVAWTYPHSLAGEMNRAGYYTQCVGKMHVHPLRNNLGFQNVELHDGTLQYYRSCNLPYYENQMVADDYFYWLKQELGVTADVSDTGLDCNSWNARPWMYEEKYHPTNWVTDRCIDFFRRRDRSQPFFLMASYVRPHAPYDAPKAFWDIYENASLRPPVSGDWNDRSLLEAQGRRYDNITGPADPELIRRQMIGYYACISHVDNQIGRLIMTMQEQGVYNDTVVIFVSDHGEMLSDHCFDRKALPYRGSISIPLILAGPEAYTGPHGVNTALAELRDILPTCVTLGGGTVPGDADGLPLTSEAIDQRDYLHGEHAYGDLSNHFIVTKTDKYVWFSQTGREQYFDLTRDPMETHDAIGDEGCQDRIQTLRQILIRELKDREEGFSDGQQLIPGRPCVGMLTRRKGGQACL